MNKSKDKAKEKLSKHAVSGLLIYTHDYERNISPAALYEMRFYAAALSDQAFGSPSYGQIFIDLFKALILMRTLRPLGLTEAIKVLEALGFEFESEGSE